MTNIEYKSCQTVDRLPSRLLWWACLSVWIHAGVSGLKVKFGVLLPERPVDRTMHPCPTVSLAMAEEWLIAEDLASLNWVVDSPTWSESSTRGWSSSTSAMTVQFNYSNSKCSDIYGLLRAIEIYYLTDEGSRSASVQSSDIRVFYGPCCKYSLAPVARFAKIWDVPVITPGGLASSFTREEFSMLIRYTAPYDKAVDVLLKLLAKYNWWHLTLMYHNNLGPDKMKGLHMCYDFAAALLHVVNSRQKDTSPTNEKATDDNDWEQKCCVFSKAEFNENNYDENKINEYMDATRNASRGQYSVVVTTKTVMRKSCRSHDNIAAGLTCRTCQY